MRNIKQRINDMINDDRTYKTRDTLEVLAEAIYDLKAKVDSIETALDVMGASSNFQKLFDDRVEKPKQYPPNTKEIVLTEALFDIVMHHLDVCRSWDKSGPMPDYLFQGVPVRILDDGLSMSTMKNLIELKSDPDFGDMAAEVLDFLGKQGK